MRLQDLPFLLQLLHNQRDIQDYKERYGVTAIVFEDDGFFTDKERALEIIRHIGVPWTSSIRTNYLVKWGDDFVEELSRHHCAELRIGAESLYFHSLSRDAALRSRSTAWFRAPYFTTGVEHPLI